MGSQDGPWWMDLGRGGTGNPKWNLKREAASGNA